MAPGNETTLALHMDAACKVSIFCIFEIDEIPEQYFPITEHW